MSIVEKLSTLGMPKAGKVYGLGEKSFPKYPIVSDPQGKFVVMEPVAKVAGHGIIYQAYEVVATGKSVGDAAQNANLDSVIYNPYTAAEKVNKG